METIFRLSQGFEPSPFFRNDEVHKGDFGNLNGVLFYMEPELTFLWEQLLSRAGKGIREATHGEYNWVLQQMQEYGEDAISDLKIQDHELLKGEQSWFSKVWNKFFN